MGVRVLIAEDEPEISAALGDLVRRDEELELVATASNAQEAVTLIDIHHPDIAIMDVKMPGGGGPWATKEAHRRSPSTRVVALSAYDDRATVLGMIRAGAVGYLVKGDSPGEVLTAIHRAMEGESTLSPAVSAEVVQELSGRLRQQADAENQLQKTARRIQAALDDATVIQPVFQGIYDLRSRETCGFEALARFHTEPPHPPDVWFADAEVAGLRTELEIAALAAEIASLSQLPSDTYLAINLSPGTIHSEDFLALLEHLPVERIVVEITEHARIDDYDSLGATLKPWRSKGLRLAVDDAGAGFASLRHILRLSPDIVKLDLSLTRGIDRDRAQRAMARALISFADETGITIVAEGIETASELEHLLGLGVRYGQGYYLAKPARPESIPSLPTS